jgi:RNA polymerase sigma factor (TIGR02999 family)
MPEFDEITSLAQRWSDGDEAALEQLIELTYPRLRRLARRHARFDGNDPTIDTTALVHEAYLHFAGDNQNIWPSRAHFFAFCSKVMRRVLIDYARRRNAEKRGGTLVRVPLADGMVAIEAQVAEVLDVEEALELLAAHNERLAKVVECKFYGGLSIDETAEALGTSSRTVVRDWTRARAYLLRALDHGDAAPGSAGTP